MVSEICATCIQSVLLMLNELEVRDREPGLYVKDCPPEVASYLFKKTELAQSETFSNFPA